MKVRPLENSTFIKVDITLGWDKSNYPNFSWGTFLTLVAFTYTLDILRILAQISVHYPLGKSGVMNDKFLVKKYPSLIIFLGTDKLII